MAYALRFTVKIWRPLLLCIVCLTLFLAVAVRTTATARAASSVDVFVGYADNLRANPSNFPTPWAGSPNTTFEGCQPTGACTYDAGAVRVVNNTPLTVTVNSIAVHIDTCTYTGWPSASLPPEASLS